MSASFNPFGKQNQEKTAKQLLMDTFGIGFQDYDFGAEKWSENRIDEETGEEHGPGWVPDPKVKSTCVVRFTVNEGQGTGAQVIPAEEFPQYVRQLRRIIDSNYEESAGKDRTEYIPTYVHASESFRMIHPKKKVIQPNGKVKRVTDHSGERSVVSVRCSGGKGSKPMTVSKDEFEEVVAALEMVAESLPQHVELATKRRDAALGSDE